MKVLFGSILAMAVLTASCSDDKSYRRERAETDVIFARTAMEILAEPAVTQMELYQRTGRFSATASAGIGVEVCGGGRVVVLDETTPHAQTFAVKLVGMRDEDVVANYYTNDVPACDRSRGAPAWPWGCVIDAAARESLQCSEALSP